MASEIIVQTIKGPTSGANANKVIIPSGQTLDASNGFIAPSGHTVQVGHSRSTAAEYFATTNTFFALAGTNLSMTAKRANSLFLYQALLSAEADATGAHNSFFRYKYRINSGSWVYHTPTLTQNGTAFLDSGGSFNEGLTYAFDGISTSAGDVIEFQLEFRTTASGVQFNQQSLSGQPSSTSNFHQIIVQEIAQ